MAPRNIKVVQLNVTHMNVSWVKLSLEEARGLVTGYTITIFVYDEGRNRQKSSAVVAVGANTSYVLIAVEPSLNYQVTVSGSTAVGEGVQSSVVYENG